MARELGLLELKLLSMAAGGEGRNREEGEGWIAGTDRYALGVVIPGVVLSWGALERATAKHEVEDSPWAFTPLPEGRRKKTPLPLWAGLPKVSVA